jgi:tRNA G18 (ribose-2'-O)-methylase SpoU
MSSFGTSQDSDQSKYLVLTSKLNEKVKLMKSLHFKKHRESEGMLLLEGHRQIVDAINSGYYPTTLLFSDEAISAPLGKQLLSSLEKCSPSTVFRASDSLIQCISDTVHCQGVIASFLKPRKTCDFTRVESPLVVLMDRPTDPGNLGAIIRTAYGMGVDAVVVVDGCDPWSPKVLRSAMGMGLKFPVVEASWNDNSVSTFLLNSTGKAGPFQLLLADADPSGSVYHRVDMTGPTVLVVGSEAAGIGAEARSLLGAKYIRIPTPKHRNDVESFNAAVAGSILIAEAARQRER